MTQVICDDIIIHVCVLESLERVPAKIDLRVKSKIFKTANGTYAKNMAPCRQSGVTAQHGATSDSSALVICI